MTDDIIANAFSEVKCWFKKYYKFLLVILLYFLYQANFLINLFRMIGLNISDLSGYPYFMALIANDLVYVFLMLFIFKKDIISGIKDLKEHFSDRAFIAICCWVSGCVIMTISSLLISLVSNQNVSNNEALVRQSIQIAPFYMLFSCTIVAPVLEEMTFRKALQGIIKNKWIFIMISGLGFGLLHVLGSYNSLDDFLYVVPYGSMGCAFAFLLSKTNNIALPIMVHMLHNFILVSTQILGG